MQLFFILFLSVLLSACGPAVYAPVTEVSTIDPIPQKGIYHVMRGDTLYSIAWRYGLDYRYLAAINRIAPPYSIYSGQKIYLKANSYAEIKPLKVVENEPIKHVRGWGWPSSGPVIRNFSELNKGINIKGYIGQAIYTAAPGKVVYSGSGLRAYGNLIIIKHNSSYLTAYAHNSRLLVREGQEVKAGQKIAEMGQTGSKEVMLHFEIRRNGQPVNPLLYLSAN